MQLIRLISPYGVVRWVNLDHIVQIRSKARKDKNGERQERSLVFMAGDPEPFEHREDPVVLVHSIRMGQLEEDD